MPEQAQLLDALRRVFGFDGFRPNQEDVVRAIFAGRDVFAVMPTGGGKSLCYQLPAHLLEGTCVVVSPLISLMKDQVDAARETGLRAALLNSSLTASARRKVRKELLDGELDLLYVAPERFALGGFVADLEAVRLSLFAVDEAHCISEWGHDFRPDYLNLSMLVGQFPRVPLAAFTATATHHVQEDIVERLGLRKPFSLRASFDRPNLIYYVAAKTGINSQILTFVQRHSGSSGIIYRTTRNSVEKTAAMLEAHGVKSLPYHAGLDDGTRKRNQDLFNRDEIDVIVATIAFGMGIDKSNVRFVVHGDLPKNIESYYQETGRAGRDGDPADLMLFFGGGDIAKIKYFVDQIEDDAQRKIATDKLYQVVRYATTNACRRRQLLAYFGERYDREDCGACDVCRGVVEQADATTEAQIIMSAIARTYQRFGAGQIIDIVTGADTDRIRKLGHDSLKTYGAGSGKTKGFWRGILNDLVAQQCVRRTDDEYPTLQITAKGGEILTGRESFHVLRQTKIDRKKKAKAKKAGRTTLADAEVFDQALFERLRTLRRKLAGEQGVPPYIIFNDRTLRLMARDVPETTTQFADISGVGEAKLARYGEVFLGEIRAHLRDV